MWALNQPAGSAVSQNHGLGIQEQVSPAVTLPQDSTAEVQASLEQRSLATELYQFEPELEGLRNVAWCLGVLRL